MQHFPLVQRCVLRGPQMLNTAPTPVRYMGEDEDILNCLLWRYGKMKLWCKWDLEKGKRPIGVALFWTVVCYASHHVCAMQCTGQPTRMWISPVVGSVRSSALHLSGRRLLLTLRLCVTCTGLYSNFLRGRVRDRMNDAKWFPDGTCEQLHALRGAGHRGWWQLGNRGCLNNGATCVGRQPSRSNPVAR